ncbi:hypothetical protein N9O57_01575 [bacterium]|nr:hypothetical protein [bacterium]
MIFHHIHFNTRNVKYWENYLVSSYGFRVKNRYGIINGTHKAFDQNFSWDNFKNGDGTVFRLEELERGAVNITLMAGKTEGLFFDHIGLCCSPLEKNEIISRSKSENFSIRENPSRVFIDPSIGFKIELTEGEDNYNKESLEDFRIDALKVILPDIEKAKSAIFEVMNVPIKDRLLFASGDSCSLKSISFKGESNYVFDKFEI